MLDRLFARTNPRIDTASTEHGAASAENHGWDAIHDAVEARRFGHLGD